MYILLPTILIREFTLQRDMVCIRMTILHVLRNIFEEVSIVRIQNLEEKRTLFSE